MKLKVDGMTCSHCERAVKEALEDVNGVETVDVNLNEGIARVTGGADVALLIAAIEEEGYQASLIEA